MRSTRSRVQSSIAVNWWYLPRRPDRTSPPTTAASAELPVVVQAAALARGSMNLTSICTR
jgi:hypothetical protein